MEDPCLNTFLLGNAQYPRTWQTEDEMLEIERAFKFQLQSQIIDRYREEAWKVLHALSTYLWSLNKSNWFTIRSLIIVSTFLPEQNVLNAKFSPKNLP
jgi:hypothetical protein